MSNLFDKCLCGCKEFIITETIKYVADVNNDELSFINIDERNIISIECKKCGLDYDIKINGSNSGELISGADMQLSFLDG